MVSEASKSISLGASSNQTYSIKVSNIKGLNIINNCQNILVGTPCKLLIEHDLTTDVPPSFEYEVVYCAQSVPKSAKVIYEQHGALLSNIDNLDSLPIVQDNPVFLSNVLADQSLHISKVVFIPDNGFGPAKIDKDKDSCSDTDLTPSTGCSFYISSKTDTAGYISLDGGATHFEHVNISGLQVTQDLGSFSSNTSQAQTYQAQYIISNKNGLNPINFTYTLDGQGFTEDKPRSTCFGKKQLDGGDSCSVAVSYTAPNDSTTDQKAKLTVHYTDSNNHQHSIHSTLVTNVNTSNIVGYKVTSDTYGIQANSIIDNPYRFQYIFKNIGIKPATNIRFANIFDPNTVTLDAKASTCRQTNTLKPNYSCIITGTFTAKNADKNYYLSSNLFYKQGHYVSLNDLTKAADQAKEPIVTGSITTDVPANNIMFIGDLYHITYTFNNIGKADANNLQFINTLPKKAAGFSTDETKSTCSNTQKLTPSSSCKWAFTFTPNSADINTSIISNLHYDNGNNVILSNENLINNHKTPPAVLENHIVITQGDSIPATTHIGHQYHVAYTIKNTNKNHSMLLTNASIPINEGGPLSEGKTGTCNSLPPTQEKSKEESCTITLYYKSNKAMDYHHDIYLNYNITDGTNVAQISKKVGTINTTTTDVTKYISATPKVVIPDDPKQYVSYPFDYVFTNIGQSSLTNVSSDVTTLTAEKGFTISKNTCQSIATMHPQDTCEISGVFYPAQQGLIGTANITLKSNSHDNLITIDLSNNNTLTVQANNAYPQMVAANYGGCIIDNNKLYCYGSALHSRFSDNVLYTPTNIYTPAAGKILKSVSASRLNTCVIVGDQSTPNNDQLYCRGSLPDGVKNQFVKVPAQGDLIVKQVASNGDPVNPYICTIEGKPGDNTQDMAYCWGYNTYGELGIGNTTSPITTPTPVDKTSIPNGYIFKYISTSNTIVQPFTCAIVGLPSDELHNQVYCWGNNTTGYLGLGSSTVKTNIDTPTKLDFGDNASVSQLVTTWYGGCVLMEGDSNQVKCWGGDIGAYNYGFPGNGTSSGTQYSPVEPHNLTTIVGQSKIIKLAAGNSTVCYLTNDKVSNLSCWGANLFFQLVNKNNTTYITRNTDPNNYLSGDTLQPTPNSDFSNDISDKDGFKDIYVGAQSTCGLSKKGSYYCWGIGDPSYFGQPKDTTISTTQVKPYPLTIPSP
ncbi:RCC1 domain-containing protein [Cysteiniphilum halobium]|uniref:RCC1 domain-containing protein n=1 Tax=Cysteiniphilum halobium TaxID=2219059 RepID=UPI000E6565F6|nr:hypothetical protein [Cysteiniphilum halobium]